MNFKLISPEKSIAEFIKNNEKTPEILDAIKPQIIKHFPESEFSLEICDELEWTTESKLLVNVCVSHEVFFNGIVNHFNEIYENIGYLIEDILCPIVLFPQLSNEKYDKMSYNSAINLIARTSYFNRDFDKNFQREMTLRDIPKSQMEKEIVEYCKIHENPDLSDIVFDLQLDLVDVDKIIDELELDVKW